MDGRYTSSYHISCDLENPDISKYAAVYRWQQSVVIQTGIILISALIEYIQTCLKEHLNITNYCPKVAKGQTTIYKALHRKLNIEQHEPH